MPMKTKPSEYDGAFWIGVDSITKKEKKENYNEFFLGKWLLFIPKDDIDKIWELIYSETENDNLGISSKVSTYLGWLTHGQQDHYVICVHTKDYRNEKDVFRVRQRLFELGFKEALEYKTDQATIQKNHQILYKK